MNVVAMINECLNQFRDMSKLDAKPFKNCLFTCGVVGPVKN